MVENKNIRIVKEDAVLGGDYGVSHTLEFGYGYDKFVYPYTVSFCGEGKYEVIIKDKRAVARKVEEVNMFMGDLGHTVEEMGKANIRAYAETLKEEILSHAPDIVTEIKCPDCQYRNRPLLDTATVIEIIDDLKKKMAQ